MAVGDRLQIADKPTLDEINTTIGDTGDTGGSTVAGTVMAKLNNIQANTDGLNDNLAYLNSTIDSENPVALDVLMTQLLYGTVFEYSKPGTYQLLIPANVNKIKVTACGGGGGGAGSKGSAGGSGGGGGGAAIENQEYTVEPQSTISITIGQGGAAGNNSTPNGSPGTATVIGNLVTLPGGMGGTYDGETNGTGGTGGGTGGGAGGAGKITNTQGDSASSGQSGISPGGAGGSVTASIHYSKQCAVGGGGGGSLGKGGDGQSIQNSSTSTRYSPYGGSAGTKGGGGGGKGNVIGTSQGTGYKGGDGYAKIELIIAT